MKNIPKYLKKYIVDQNYGQYSFIHHACWRFIMKLNEAYFANYAHDKYLKGIKDTGITIDRIPKIEDINKKLQKFGWSAVGVRGFLPPLIFMDFQSKGILPIACDMRSINHLTYTPAPDIVHEAAGHSPMIADSDYSEYLKYYGQIARKAISSSEDYNLYIAIRKLSDIKENTQSTQRDIKKAESSLKNAVNSISYISEAAYLARINWWTVEYGLVGDINNPKIYGAGLLSSIGESENCFKDSVKKIPLSIDCINYSYDITEQQPQLFVSEDFKSLNKVLDSFSSSMAYKIGGLKGISEAIQSKTVCTIVLDSDIQISGKVETIADDSLSYLQLSGPVQLSYSDKEISGHGTSRHPQGFGFPLGKLIDGIKIDSISKNNLFALGYKIEKDIEFKFKSGVIIKGVIKSVLEKNNYVKIITLNHCTVKYNDEILFEPAWGEYDMVCGQNVKSVFGGPADMDRYFKNIDDHNQINTLNDAISVSNSDKRLNQIYSEIRSIREEGKSNVSRLKELFKILSEDYPKEWLGKLEIYEIIHHKNIPWIKELRKSLYLKVSGKSDTSKAIKSFLQLIEK